MSLPDDVERVFEEGRYQNTLARMRREFARPEFWRALNPGLTISECPFAVRPVRSVPADTGAACGARLLRDGYFVSPPLVTDESAVRFRAGVERIAAEGYPTTFACVYDEYWRLFTGLEPLLEPIVGHGYRLVAEGLWTFFVPPGHSGRGKWGPVGAHRDSLGPDAGLVAGDSPTVVNLWIPLADATPANSCMYVLPAPQDPGYRAGGRHIAFDLGQLQDVRALPAPAGAVLGWTTHLIHWGSRSSPDATAPRISATAYVQRRDRPPVSTDTLDFQDPVPFERRLHWIAASIAEPDLFK